MPTVFRLTNEMAGAVAKLATMELGVPYLVTELKEALGTDKGTKLVVRKVKDGDNGSFNLSITVYIVRADALGYLYCNELHAINIALSTQKPEVIVCNGSEILGMWAIFNYLDRGQLSKIVPQNKEHLNDLDSLLLGE